MSLGVLDRWGSRAVGVAELFRGGIGDGDARLKDLGGCPALRFLPVPARGRLLLPVERTLPFRAGVVESSLLPKFGIITDDAGELPGVSLLKLPMVERSFETMLEIESLSCWFLWSACSSSSVASSSFIWSFSASHFCCMSECNLNISPLTVRRSLTPFSIIDNTLSMAGP